MLGANDGRRSVVVGDVIIHNQIAHLEVAGHRCTRIRRRMLDVRPIHVAAGKREIRLDRLAGIVWIADDQSANDVEAVPVQMLDRFGRRMADDSPVVAARVLRGRPQERQVLVEDIFDAEEDIAESRASHEGRQRGAVLGEGRSHRLHDVLEIVEAVVYQRFAQRFEAPNVERDVVVDEKDRLGAVPTGVGDVR